MNITDSEILKLKHNMGYIKNDKLGDNRSTQIEVKNLGLSESAKSKRYNNNV